MNKTLLVMRNEIRSTLRRKTFLIIGFGFPLAALIISLALIAFRGDGGDAGAEPEPVQTYTEGYIDPAGIVSWLPPDAPADWLRRFDNEADAAAALQAGKIRNYYVISPDFAETGSMRAITDEMNPLSGDLNSSGFALVLIANLAENSADAQQMWQPMDLTVTALTRPAAETETGLSNDSDNWLTGLFPTLMTLVLYMVILIPAGILVAAITDEKKNRVMEVLLLSVSPRELLNGKFVALALLGLLQAAMWVGVVWVVTRFGGEALAVPDDFSVPTQLLVWSIIYFLLGYAIYGALMAGLGALAPDVRETRGPSFLIMSPIIIGYMLMFVIFDAPNSAPALALSLFPLTAPVSMISRMTVTAVPLWQLVLSAALQLATALFILRAVARMFRAQALLSGQPVGTKQYVNALFGRI